MNPRILVAFAAGAMAASGLVFVAFRPVARQTPTPPAQTAAYAPARVIPAILPDVRSADDLVTVQGHPAPLPVVRYKKPSPIPVTDKKWPADKPEPVEMAGNVPPAPAAGDSRPLENTVESFPPPQVAVQPPTPTPIAPQADAPPAEPPRTPHTVVLRPGTLISVRTGENLSTEQTRIGDRFFATLDEPLVIDGWIIAARGSRAEGRIVTSDGSELGLQLTAINTTDNQHLGIGTATFLRRAPGWQDRDTATVGGAAAIGAVIGAVAGGGKGAGIGAVVGGAAGAGGVLATRQRNAGIPVETRISFRVDQPLTITEHLN